MRAGAGAKVKSKAKSPAKATSTIRFGWVKLEVANPTKRELKHNIDLGQSALARAKDELIRPGLQIKKPRNVPLYHVDPDKPEQLIQRLGGRTTKGTFVNGKFKPLTERAR
jgi:hypothetical protein